MGEIDLNELNPIVKVILEGVYDENCILSKLRREMQMFLAAGEPF